MLTFEPAKHLASGARTGGEFADALRRFYPTNPPMPALTNPLIASYDNDNGSDLIYTKYYHMPKWIIPTSSISSIRTLVPHPPRDPSSAVARTFIIQTLDRDYVLRAPSAELFSRWTFLLSRMSATGGDHGVLDETRVTANGGMMYTDDDPQFVEAEDEDDDLDDQGPYSATGRGGDPYLSRQQQPPLQHDEFMNSPFITRADQPQPYYAGQQAQYQQPQQQQHQQLNQYRSQQAPPQIDIDITHDALPRLDEWHKSISDLIDRDSAARNSMLTVSAAGSGSLDRPPTIERGKARQSFLGTGPIGSAGILDAGLLRLPLSPILLL
ncbi:hypothetical protein BC830DRAFT_77286 [Chytriomyces sp. MP71]|nr:hypothetical protein BC830DRAFT_77286 [Chytriomyces sp. MP71]